MHLSIRNSIRPSWHYLVPMLLLCLVPSAAPAQDPTQVSVDELSKDDRKNMDLWKRLMKGDQPANLTDKQQQEAMDAHVRFLMFRFANSQYHKPAALGDKGINIDRIAYEFGLEVNEIQGGKEKTKECARLFTRSCIENGKKVLDTRIPIAQVNIGRCLVQVASLGAPEMAEGLVQLLGEQYNDAVKYLLLKAARDLLIATGNSQPLGKDLEQKLAVALINVATREIKIGPTMTREEIDGQLLLRFEAIRALAQLRTPLFSAKDRPGLVLLQIVAGEGYKPSLDWDERFEAAIGLAHMRPDKEGDYQTAYAAQQIALFLGQFVEFYNERGQKVKRPWKIYARRLLDALEGLRAESKDPYLFSLFDVGKPGTKVLEELEKGNKPNQTDMLAVASNPPPQSQLFKSQGDSKLKGNDKKP
jgi:hypothetical protein